MAVVTETCTDVAIKQMQPLHVQQMHQSKTVECFPY